MGEPPLPRGEKLDEPGGSPISASPMRPRTSTPRPETAFSRCLCGYPPPRHGSPDGNVKEILAADGLSTPDGPIHSLGRQS